MDIVVIVVGQSALIADESIPGKHSIVMINPFTLQRNPTLHMNRKYLEVPKVDLR